MSLPQQGDVLMFTADSTELVRVVDQELAFTIRVTNGVVEMTAAFETAAALSLFGGNFEDDGTPGNPLTYWGNLTETDPAAWYVSRTQYLLEALPASSANLLQLEEAAGLDLAWFVSVGAASSVDVVASIPTIGRVDLAIAISARGVESHFTFSPNWKAAV